MSHHREVSSMTTTAIEGRGEAIPLSNAHAAWVAEHLEGMLLVWLGVLGAAGQWGTFDGGGFRPLRPYAIYTNGDITWREERQP